MAHFSEMFPHFFSPDFILLEILKMWKHPYIATFPHFLEKWQNQAWAKNVETI